jgi:hypothetical protein
MDTGHLESWHDFYLMVGGGSAALTGLLFVIVSLGPHVVAGQRRPGVRAFISPVATHFTYAFVIAALMLAPGLSSETIGWSLIVAGLGGIVYMIWTRVSQRWRENNLSTLDWVWFVAMPHVCFALLFASGIGILKHSPLGLDAVGIAAILLIITGIRNAWDLVLWVAQQPRPEQIDPRTGGGEPPPNSGHRRKLRR